MTPVSAEDKAKLEKVIGRIRKLLALGTSPNEHEAALAVSKAQEMLAAYDLTMESIEDLKADARTGIQRGAHIVKTTQGKPEGWKEELFDAVAETSDCFTAIAYEYENIKGGKTRQIKHGKLIGFAHDVEMAGYELAFLIGEIERLAQDYANLMWAEIREIEKADGVSHQQAESYYTKMTGRHPLKAKLYFIKGATEAVRTNLHAAYRERHRAAAAGNPNAIVLQKRRSVADWISIERYGVDVATRDAQWKARDEEYRANHPQKFVKTETDAEQKKRETAEAKSYAKHQARWAREAEAERRKTDHTAVKAGREAGATVTTRKGIREGANHTKLED